MIIFSGKRGTGKTKELISYCLDNNCAIACSTKEKQDQIVEKSIAYFNQPVKTILFSELKEYNGKVALDDAWDDLLDVFKLKYEFTGDVAAITREV